LEEPNLPTFSPRDLTLAEDVEAPGDWRVEYFDDDGAGYVTIFAGPSAEARARDYFEAMQAGQINNRIEDGMADGPFTIEMPMYNPSDAVSAQIIAWKRGRLAVEYCYPGGTTEAGPIQCAGEILQNLREGKAQKDQTTKL
jgi:hypothetical protein